MSCQPSNSSGLLTTNNKQLVAAGISAVVHSAIMITDGTNAGTVVVYSGSAATAGNELIKLQGAAADRYVEFHSDGGILSNGGLFVTVAGTNAAYIIHYQLV